MRSNFRWISDKSNGHSGVLHPQTESRRNQTPNATECFIFRSLTEIVYQSNLGVTESGVWRSHIYLTFSWINTLLYAIFIPNMLFWMIIAIITIFTVLSEVSLLFLHQESTLLFCFLLSAGDIVDFVFIFFDSFTNLWHLLTTVLVSLFLVFDHLVRFGEENR